MRDRLFASDPKSALKIFLLRKRMIKLEELNWILYKMVQVKYLFLGSGLNSRLPEIWLPETISSQMFFKTHQQKCSNSPPYQPSPLFTSSTLFFLFVFVLWRCSCRFFVDVFFILMFPIVLKELEKWVYFRHLGHTDTCQTIVTSFKYRHRKSKRKE